MLTTQPLASVSLLLLMSAGLAGAAQPGDSFNKQTSRAIKGYNNEELNGVSLDTCLTACLQETGFCCRSVDYDFVNEDCYLSDEWSGTQTVKGYSDYDYYERRDHDCVEQCSSNPCKNGGNCTNGIDQYMCTCVAGFDGVNCELTLCPTGLTDSPVYHGGGPLSVASYLVAPYLKYDTNTAENVTGNDQFTGFVKDLMEALSTEMEVDYELHLADGYGVKHNNEWTGMIGEVFRKEAQVAAGPLTVTLAREEAVDFTYPFQRTEATIVMSKRHFNQEPHIASLDDLVNQDVVAYGVVKDGSIYQFLKDSKKEVHQKMWDKISSNTFLHLEDDNNKGVYRARTDSNYAFIMDGSLADWLVGQEPCNLELVKTGFYQRQYALAVENQSPLRDRLNVALVELEDSGVMDELRKKWLSPDACASAGRGGGLPLFVLAAIAVCSFLFTRWQS